MSPRNGREAITRAASISIPRGTTCTPATKEAMRSPLAHLPSLRAPTLHTAGAGGVRGAELRDFIDYEEIQRPAAAPRPERVAGAHSITGRAGRRGERAVAWQEAPAEVVAVERHSDVKLLRHDRLRPVRHLAVLRSTARRYRPGASRPPTIISGDGSTTLTCYRRIISNLPVCAAP